MYLDYWSLERPPFEAVPDSRFFFPNPQHEQGLAAINYAARQATEPVWITGPPGCGKTLLLRTLRRQLNPQQYQVAFVPQLRSDQVSVLGQVAYNLTHSVAADAAAAIDLILQAVAEAEAEQRSLVIMLDDWPVEPTPSALSELRWLLNLDLDKARACVLLTAEGPNPATTAADPPASWPAWLQQRLLATVMLGPLPARQVPAYLEHRLRCAGHADGALFTAAAAEAIGRWSEGVPRLINRLAHLALQVAAVQSAQRVEEAAVQQAIQRLSNLTTPVPRPAEAKNRQ